jgi:hypothetical protein
MPKLTKVKVTLPNEDVKRLQQALGVLPQRVEGYPYAVTARRGEIERRRVSLVKAEIPTPSKSQEFYRLCRYNRKDGFVTIGYALRSIISGDYFVFSEMW